MPETDLTSTSLLLDTETYQYRTPMKFGGRVVGDVTILNVHCDALASGGAAGRGLGSMTLGNVWAWPSRHLDAQQTHDVLVSLARRLVDRANDVELAGHPLEMCVAFAEHRVATAEALERELRLPEPIPPLAVLLAASPIEAAWFDAHGKAAGLSSFAMLGAEHLPSDLSRFLGAEFRGLALDRFVAPRPADVMPLYHLVGALDPLGDQDVVQPVGDGLPESLAGWIARDGLTHLKIKLDGADMDWDLRRILQVDRVADGGPRGAGAPWHFSLDFNERCANEEYVLRLLDALQRASATALPRIQYIEQPTHRDLASHPNNTMHRVSQRVPVVIDESLLDYDSLLLAREQGYTGVAIKACKGHGEALLMAAAAAHHGMYLCVQDLTCVGASFLHSASLTAHLPGAAAIEGNGRQYCPSANERWKDAFPGLFDVRNGTLPTAQLDGPGLGYAIPEAG